MEKRTSAFARILAVLALAAAVVALIAVVSGGVGEDSAKRSRQAGSEKQEQTEREKPKYRAATYEVKSGDTLTRISYLTGVKVTKLIELNPELDPQILEVGAKLKVR